MISLIVAVSKNGVIGKDNQLLWRLRTDMQRFRKLTMGKPVIMGRRTFHSIGKPLPGRDNIIISRQAGFEVEGAFVVPSVAAGLALGAQRSAPETGNEVMVIGGAMIYEATRSVAGRIYLSLVEAEMEGDVFFELPSPDEWELLSSTFCPAGEKDEFAHHFHIYERV